MEKVLFAWSGGKDSAMALYETQKSEEYNVAALLTTVTQDYDRISMHGVRRALLEEQAALLGIPLETVLISKHSSNEEYEAKMKEALVRYKKKDIVSVVFGDIFLEDLKKYREDNLAKVGLKGVFPIWKRDTRELAAAFIDLGFKAIITCVDSKSLDKSFAGRVFDKQFLSDLPNGIDPCGENGEFHSFVYDGPIFSRGIIFEKGQVVLRDNRFYYCDLVEAENLQAVSG
jgi:uncharacterized protein (TIGR00290 family)